MEYQHLIIAGLPRSGSTSLYTYLLPHPDICASRVKETQYFLRSLTGDAQGTLEEYTSFFAHWSGQKYKMESSPSYFFAGAEIAKLINDVLEDVRLIFLFRDPVDRVFSYFTHEKMVGNLSKDVTFDALLGSEKFEREKVIESGFYIDYLEPWFEYFRGRIEVVFFDDLKNDPNQVMRNLCSWLEIAPSFYDDYNFVIENRGALYRNKILHIAARGINTKFETFFRSHIHFKRFLRKIYYFINEGRAEESDNLKPKIREYLENLYAPYNDRLCEFLIGEGYEISGWLEPHKALE